MKHPVIQNFKNSNIYFSIWAIIIIAHISVLHLIYHQPLLLSVADGLIFNCLFAGLAISFWYPVRYLSFDSNKQQSLVRSHMVLAFLFLSIWIFTGYIATSLFSNEKLSYSDFFYSSIPWRIFSGILYYSLIILFYYLHIYYLSFKDKLTKEAQLQTTLKETELSLLKTQINPHFIFNSLNSVNSLIYTKPDAASEMLVKLSAFLRNSLDQSNRQLISFEEELDNCQLYLEIEKTRFDEKLIFNTHIEPECTKASIPNMLLQPLVENAVKFGVYESTETVTIHLNSQIQNNMLIIQIINNYDSESFPKKGKGIGIKNVRERLYLIYGHSSFMTIHKTDHLFEVLLKIPQEYE